MNLLALVWRHTGRLAESIDLYRKTLELQRTSSVASEPTYYTCLNNLGYALQQAGRLDEAQESLREALQGRRRALGNNHSDTVQSMENLSNCLHELGRKAEAAELLIEAMGACAQFVTRQPAELQHATRLAENVRAANQRAWGCVSRFEASPAEIEIATKLAQAAVQYAPAEPKYWNTLGLARYRSGDWEEALRALEHAHRLRASAAAEDLVVEAMCHWQLGDYVAATAAYAEVLESTAGRAGTGGVTRSRLLDEAGLLLGSEPSAVSNR